MMPGNCIRFHDEEHGDCCRKTCLDQKEYEKYARLFHLEFQHMRRLQCIMEKAGEGELYGRLFPHYYGYWQDADKKPYILMEYIPHTVTLEEYLAGKQRYASPYPYLTSRQISHIYLQLMAVTSWLRRGGMINFDLSPQNILIIDQARLDIRLVDFTHCYFFNDQKYSYKRLDYHIDPNLSLANQLRNTGAFLFTRLFYSGNDQYSRLFRSSSQETRGYFLKEYPGLLNCIFGAELQEPDLSQDLLASWEEWCGKMIRHLGF